MSETPSDPQNIITVHRVRDGVDKTIRHHIGHILVCKGCCCGNVENGHAAVPLDAWKETWKSLGIRKRIHLTISGCLGPCPLANVVLVTFRGESIWLQGIDTEAQVLEVYRYLGAMIDAGKSLTPPTTLRSFVFPRYVDDMGSKLHLDDGGVHE